MPYLIDGHNLIPKIPGFSLAEIDDDMRLIELLQEFCRRQGKEALVFFDNAPAGAPPARKFGRLTAYFVRAGMSADQAILNRLKRLGGEARNWSVVSSDLSVKAAARAAHARVLSSEEFARLLVSALEADGTPAEKPEDSG